MRLLMLIIFSTTIFAFGCGEDMEEDKVVEPEETSLEKAQAAMARVSERRTEAHKKAEEAGDFSTIVIAAGGIYQEELGFGEEVWQELLNTWGDAHHDRTQGLIAAGKEDESMAEIQEYANFLGYYFSKFQDPEGGLIGSEFWFEYMAAYDDIVIEYLRLSYENPDSTQGSLLALLKKSMVDGKVSIQYPEEYPEE